MKVTIIVGGRFHAFDLAEYLDKNNYLEKLITSYPKFYFNRNYINIKKKNIKNLFLKELLNRFFLKIPFISKIVDINDISSEIFRKQASKNINYNKTNILIGWSGFSLESFKIAAQYNHCIKVLERGSTHIEFQNNILKEEYERLGIKPNLPSKKNIFIEKKEYNLSDYIVVPTKFAKKTFIEKGFLDKKIIIVPYGVNLNEFRIFKNKKKNETDSKFRIIYVGTISVRKGVIYLLQAFKNLNLENSELILIGKIDDDIKQIIIKYIDNNKIIWFKEKKQSDLAKFYNSANLFITCSLEEGLAMVQLQAMACGLPLICTPNSGGDEIVIDEFNGYIVPVRNVELLKDKILYLYKNRKILKQMGNNSRLKAINYFSWEHYGQNIVSIYKKILESKSKI